MKIYGIKVYTVDCEGRITGNKIIAYTITETMAHEYAKKWTTEIENGGGTWWMCYRANANRHIDYEIVVENVVTEM